MVVAAGVSEDLLKMLEAHVNCVHAEVSPTMKPFELFMSATLFHGGFSLLHQGFDGGVSTEISSSSRHRVMGILEKAHRSLAKLLDRIAACFALLIM